MNALTIIIVLLVVLLGLLYIFRNKLVSFMSFGITVLMVLSGIAVLLGLFVPPFFTAWASYSLENAGTLESIRKVDDTISLSAVQSAAGSAWETITGWFGVTPKPTGTATPQNQTQKGVLETKVYPEIVSTLANTYRTLTIVIGLAVMGISVYLSYATSGVAEAAVLSVRVAQLEARIKELEK